MEYQNGIENLLDNENIHPSKFSTKNWVEIVYESHRTYNTQNVRLKTTLFKVNVKVEPLWL